MKTHSMTTPRCCFQGDASTSILDLELVGYGSLLVREAGAVWPRAGAGVIGRSSRNPDQKFELRSSASQESSSRRAQFALGKRNKGKPHCFGRRNTNLVLVEEEEDKVGAI